MSTNFWWCPTCGALMEVGYVRDGDHEGRALCRRHGIPYTMHRLTADEFGEKLKAQAANGVPA